MSAERDLDPARNTVPDASTYYVMSVDLETGAIATRQAEQEDLRHCASCTCPAESDVVLPPAVQTPERPGEATD